MDNKIKLFVMDVDGTLTDGKINMGPDGELFKSFNIRDGYGIMASYPPLSQAGLPRLWRTGQRSCTSTNCTRASTTSCKR